MENSANSSIKKILSWIAIVAILLPGLAFAARTSVDWVNLSGTSYIQPNFGIGGIDLLVFGSNHYINFNTLTGSSGYGLRDNGGTMEFKNSGGSWTGIGTGGGGGGGGGGGWTFLAGAIYNSTTTDQVLVDETSTTTPAKLEVNGLSAFKGGFLSLASSTVVGRLQFTVGSSTSFTTSGTSYAGTASSTNLFISGIQGGVLATDITGAVSATTSIGTNLLTGTLGIINTQALTAGGSITVTAASSTLLANNNTFSGNNIFNSTITGSVSGNAGTATALQNARLINSVSFNGTSDITINAASSTLLSNNNTFSGNDTFSNTITGAVSGNAGSATILQTGRAINGVTFNGSIPITINAASSTALGDVNTWTKLQTLAAASSTNFTASNFWLIGQSAGCAQFDSNAKLTSTGVNCGTGSGSTSGDPFTHPTTARSATSTTLELTGGFLSGASSTINGNATTTGSFFATIASSTFTYGANLKGCNSGNFLQWASGQFGCATPTGSGTINSGTANQLAYYAADGTAVSGTSTLTFAPSGIDNRLFFGDPSFAKGVTYFENRDSDNTGGMYSQGNGDHGDVTISVGPNPNTYMLLSDNDTNKQVDIETDATSTYAFGVRAPCFSTDGVNCITSGGSATSGGSQNYIQYNNTNTLAGSVDFQWDNTNKILSLATSSDQTSSIITGGTFNMNVKGDGEPLNITTNTGLTAGSTGGNINITAGNGSTTAVGGIITFTGGSGSTNTANGTGNGSDVRLAGGVGGQNGNTNGGSINFRPGVAHSSGSNGTIQFANVNNGFNYNWNTDAITGGDQTLTLANMSGTVCLRGVNCPATTTVNTWTGLQIFGAASTTMLTNTGTTWLTALSNGPLAVDSVGKVYKAATTTYSSPLTYSNGAATIQAASVSQNGYESSFDNQLIHTATTTFTAPLTYTVGTNAVTCTTCVLNTRNINTTYPVQGGGALSSDLTLTFPATSTLYGSGTPGQVLMWNGSGVPSWAATSSSGLGSVTSITAGTGLNGGTITNAGTVSLASYFATNTPDTAGQILYWNTTNGTPAKFSSIGTSTLSASSPLTGSFIQIGSGGSLGIQQASATQNGYESSFDSQLLHTATTTFSAPLVYTLGTNAVTVTNASAGVTGALTGTDWSTFNNKQNALSGGVFGMIGAWTGASTIAPTSTPAAASYIATSTTATSTFAGAIQIGPTSGSNALKVTATATTTASITTGGLFNLGMSTFDGSALVVTGSKSAVDTGRLVVINQTNTNDVQDMMIASSSCANCTAVNLKGAPTGKGILKIEATGGGTGYSNASGLSIDLLNETDSQGIFVRGATGGTGNLLNLVDAVSGSIFTVNTNGKVTAKAASTTDISSSHSAFFPNVVTSSLLATSTFAGPVQITPSGLTTTPLLFVGTSTTGTPLYGAVQGDVIDGEMDFNGTASFNIANAGNGACASSGYWADGNIVALASDYAFFGFTNAGWTGSGCAMGNALERPESTIISNPTGDMNFELGSTSPSVAFKWYTQNTTKAMTLTNTGFLGIASSTPTFPLSVVGQTYVSATSTVGGLNVLNSGVGTSTMYLYSKTTGFGGQIIMEDAGGGACTSITTKAGVITGAVAVCPTEL